MHVYACTCVCVRAHVTQLLVPAQRRAVPHQTAHRVRPRHQVDRVHLHLPLPPLLPVRPPLASLQYPRQVLVGAEAAVRPHRELAVLRALRASHPVEEQREEPEEDGILSAVAVVAGRVRRRQLPDDGHREVPLHDEPHAGAVVAADVRRPFVVVVELQHVDEAARREERAEEIVHDDAPAALHDHEEEERDGRAEADRRDVPAAARHVRVEARQVHVAETRLRAMQHDVHLHRAALLLLLTVCSTVIIVIVIVIT